MFLKLLQICKREKFVHFFFTFVSENIGKDESERKLIFRWYFDLVPYTTSPYYEWVMIVQVSYNNKL